MRIVHVLLEAVHGPLTYADLTSGGRGVTGSEQAMLYLAKAQANAGHHVVCYLPTDGPGYVGGVELVDVRAAWPRLRKMDRADVAVSWLSADPLRNVGPKPLKIHSLQINDWMMCGYDYQKSVDLYVVCTQAHKDFLWTGMGNPGPEARVEIIPNGTDVAKFSGGAKRIPRRCVYMSSPDRGLHWLLAMWPEIRYAHPDAELHIFYEVQKWMERAVLLNSEVGSRAKYVAKRIPALRNHGVVLRGAVHPGQMAQELASADVLLYPCDTIRFTEGFSCSIMDACAAGVVPVITDKDALGEVYQESGSVVIPTSLGRAWTDNFVEAAIKLLGNEEEKESRRKRVQEFAKNYDWEVICSKWQDVIGHYIGSRA